MSYFSRVCRVILFIPTFILHFLLLNVIIELQEAFIAEAEETKRPKLLLTAAVPVGPDSIRGGYDVPAVAK